MSVDHVFAIHAAAFACFALGLFLLFSGRR